MRKKGFLLSIGWLALVLGCEPASPEASGEKRLVDHSQETTSSLELENGTAANGSASETDTSDTSDTKLEEDLKVVAQSIETIFDDYTEQTGIEFSYGNGRSANEYAIVESLGGGVGVFDFDNDGWVDVLFTGGGTLDNKSIQSRRCGLFRNLGDWRFDDRTHSAHAVADHCFTHGIATADIDADGFEDVAISGYGALQILINQGDGTFVGLEPIVTHPSNPWSSSLAWGDLDNNGHIDLYVAHYVDWNWEKHPVCAGQGVPREVCAPREFSGLTDVVYFNDGAFPFRAESDSIGLVSDGKGLGVIICDLNADHAVDIYIANDTTDNFLYTNQGDGRFVESAVFAGVSGDDAGVSTGSMGICVLDYNRDRLPDLFVTNFERELSALYRNEGAAGFFSFASRQAGLASYGSSFVGFGTVAVDFNFDNQQDIVVANGHVSYHSPHAPYRQIPLLLENRDSKFQLRPSTGYFSLPHTGRGMASGDFDNDAAVDLAISHLEEPVALLRCRPANKQPESQGAAPSKQPNERANADVGHWGTVRLVGILDNRSAIGASLHWEEQGKRYSRFNIGGGSYLSASDRRLQVYWSSHSEQIAVEVVWPSGLRENFDIASSRETVLRQGTGRTIATP